jgi:hypothetical protein
MGASKSSPVFLGQGPLPEFDYSQQPLPDNMRVLLWLLDGAERRHRVARSWRGHGYPAGNDVRRNVLQAGGLSTASWQAFPRGGRSTFSDLAGGVRRESLEARQREGKRAGVDWIKRALPLPL